MLGTALAEVQPEAERVLAAVRRDSADAAPCLASLATPAAQVSPAPELGMGGRVGVGESGSWETRACGPGSGRSWGLFLTRWRSIKTR